MTLNLVKVPVPRGTAEHMWTNQGAGDIITLRYRGYSRRCSVRTRETRMLGGVFNCCRIRGYGSLFGGSYSDGIDR